MSLRLVAVLGLGQPVHSQGSVPAEQCLCPAAGARHDRGRRQGPRRQAPGAVGGAGGRGDPALEAAGSSPS